MKKNELIKLAQDTHKASRELYNLSTEQKNLILSNIYKNISENTSLILKNNDEDIKNSIKLKKDASFIDRLTLTEKKIQTMVCSIKNIIKLHDPVGKILDEKIIKNEMNLKKITVPLGVVGVIYESRPDITTDISCLGIKSGNAIILKGGKESINTNIILEKIVKDLELKNLEVCERIKI